MKHPGYANTYSFIDTVTDWTRNHRKTVLKIITICIILAVSCFVHSSNVKRNDVIVEPSGSTQTDQAMSVGETAPGGALPDTVDTVPIYVDISGAVQNPGVYEVPPQTRLFELINRAGGLTDNADLDLINQAAYVADGDKVVIPVKGGETDNRSINVITGKSAEQTININTADKEDLMKLPGIGGTLADRIIEYRSTTRFQRIEDIMNVSGIGQATFEKMKGRLTV